MKMKNEIIRFWLTHHYLKKLGKKYPMFFVLLINDITDHITTIELMKKRYIEGLKFEYIAAEMNVDVRYLFRLHQKVIDKLIEV